jgi:phosphohistidine phosphatase
VSAAPGHTLWLLRHAKTVADPPPGGDDFDRVLAPRGRRDAEALGLLIGSTGKGLGLGKLAMPQLALVSPAARTVATADLVLGGMGTPPRQERSLDLYGAEPDEVLEHLRLVTDEITSVMVVGHNPTAHALGGGLITAEDTKGRDLVVRRGFPTCALGVYRLGVDTWAEVGAECATLRGLFIPPFAKS